MCTLQKSNISNLGKSKIIFKSALGWDISDMFSSQEGEKNLVSVAGVFSPTQDSSEWRFTSGGSPRVLFRGRIPIYKRTRYRVACMYIYMYIYIYTFIHPLPKSKLPGKPSQFEIAYPSNDPPIPIFRSEEQLTRYRSISAGRSCHNTPRILHFHAQGLEEFADVSQKPKFHEECPSISGIVFSIPTSNFWMFRGRLGYYSDPSLGIDYPWDNR